MKVLEEGFSIDDFDHESIREYRRRYDSLHAGGAWTKLADDEFLVRIGAAKKKDGKIYPTAAGLLMFGQEYQILYEFPEYFLDYREKLDPNIRWTDQVQTQSGDWSGNVFDFFCTVYPKITADFKKPFYIEGIVRLEEGPRHRAVREVIANCLVNTDFFQAWSVMIEKYPDRIELANPGLIRVGKEQMIHGGVSEPRNKALLKMFNQIGIGERAGSGVPEVFATWKNEGLKAPEIREQFGPDKPDRTIIILPLESGSKSGNDSGKKMPDKMPEKNNVIKLRHQQILNSMETDEKYSAEQIAGLIGLKERRTRDLLRELEKAGKIITEGSTKGKRYIKL